MAYLLALNPAVLSQALPGELGEQNPLQNGSTTFPLQVSVQSVADTANAPGGYGTSSDNEGTLGGPLQIEVEPGPGEEIGELTEVTLTSFAFLGGSGDGNSVASVSESYTFDGTNVPILSYTMSGGNFYYSAYNGPSAPVVTTLFVPVGATFTLSITASCSATFPDPLGEGEGAEAGDVVVSSVTVVSPDIAVTSMSFDASGGVDYGYAISGADLPEATTVALYWASGTTTDTEIGSPIATTTTDTAQGTYPLQASPDLGDRPEGAEYLLAVADPDNDITPADPSKVAALALPDVDSMPMSFDAVGDVNYGYTISNADLPQPTTVDLYWASGTTTDTEIGSPIATTTTDTAQGTYPLEEARSELGIPPAGAEYILAVVDPDGEFQPSGNPDGVQFLQLPELDVSSFVLHPDPANRWASNPNFAGGVDFTSPLNV